MTPEFFRFPHTPHIAWLAKGETRDDKVLSDAKVKAHLAGMVVVEEKLEGANLGFSSNAHGDVQAQNCGLYLQQPFAGKFARLPDWLAHAGIGLNGFLDLMATPVI